MRTALHTPSPANIYIHDDTTGALPSQLPLRKSQCLSIPSEHPSSHLESPTVRVIWKYQSTTPSLRLVRNNITRKSVRGFSCLKFCTRRWRKTSLLNYVFTTALIVQLFQSQSNYYKYNRYTVD